MDNQQERLDFEIGYLLGIIDGEGHYGLKPEWNKQRKRYFYPEVVIANSNPEIITKCSETLKKLEIPHYIYTPKRHRKEKIPVTRILIKGMKRINKFCQVLGQYPSAKLLQLNTLKEFCDMRLSIPLTELCNSTNTYSEKELWYKNRVSELNGLYSSKAKILRDYTLDALPKSDDIVRTYAKV